MPEIIVAGAAGFDPSQATTPSQLALLLLYIAILILWAAMKLKRKMAHSETIVTATAMGGTNGGDVASKNETPLPTTTPSSRVNEFTWFPTHLFALSSEGFQLRRALVIFGAIVGLLYIADGPSGIKIPFSSREYNRDLFIFICICVTIMAFLTSRPTHKSTSKPLNREQTEEWKGMMQTGFVLYHYFAAKEAYNLIRLFIAAYVWMTGFGNFSYLWTRNDYSLVRMAKMLIRLNFLVFFVVSAMNKPYMLYYVCPLHTFYFLCVFLAMAIRHDLNTQPKWMAVKFGALFLSMFIMFEIPGVFEIIWTPLFPVVQYEGSLHEWKFRAGLDHYIAIFGMLFAYFYPNMEDWLQKVEARPLRTQILSKATVLAIITIPTLYYSWIYLPLNKFDYNAIHPYWSFLPITCYIVYRNIIPGTRSLVLGLFQWSGKITLETYIVQFHFWLVHDAKARLLYIDGYPLCNFLIATAIFIGISYVLFETTTTINEALIPTQFTSKMAMKRAAFVVTGYLCLYSFSAILLLFL